MKKFSRNKNSVKIFFAATIFAAITLTASNYFINQTKGVEVAKINNQIIYKAQLIEKLQNVFKGQDPTYKIPELASLPEQIFTILAKEIYLEQNISKEAHQAPTAKSAETKEKIAAAKEKIIRQAYLDEILKNETSETKISEKYNELVAEISGKKEYEISHIIVEKEEEATKLFKRLSRAPYRFARLAKKHSIDQESAVNGGSLGFVLENNIIPEIAAILPELRKNKVSDPIKTKFGWHIVKISDIRDSKIADFESIKEAIKAQIIQDKLKEINSRIMQDFEVEIILKLKEKEPEQIEEKSDLEKSQSIPAHEEPKEQPSQPEPVKNQENGDQKELQKEE